MHILIVLTAVMEVYVTGGTLRQPWNMEETTPFYLNVSLRLTEAQSSKDDVQGKTRIKNII